ncbi:MAG: PAS domain S-box protein, partial [Pyrinomonadaceae bacterium]
EEEIRRLSRQNAVILDSAGEGLYGLDLDGITTFVNPAAAQMIGWEIAELIGRSQHAVLHHSRPDGTPFPREDCAILKTIKDGKIRQVADEVFWRQDGTYFPVEYTSTPIRENGRLAGVVVNFRDITDRKRGEVELRQSEQRYRALVENAYDIFYTHDLVGNFTWVNKAAEMITGYTLEECLQLSLTNAVAPENLDEALGMMAKTFAGENVPPRLLEIVAKDGHRIPIEVKLRLIKENGVTTGVQGIARDVTESRIAEDAQRESEKRYRLLFDSNPLPMWVYDTETMVFLAVNEAAIQHYGYSLEEFLSMSIADIRPREDVAALIEDIARDDGTVHEARVWRHHKKNGEVMSVEITSHGLNFAGRPAKLVLANDVTERSKDEAIQDRRTAQLALRLDINAALADGETDQQKTLERCTAAFVRHLNAAFARIWTLNQDENVLELQASSGLYVHLDGAHARVPVGSSKIGLIAQERRPYHTNEVQNDPRVSDQEWAKREGMVSFAGFPLIVEERLVGVIAMFSREPLFDDVIDGVASVADLISQDIERKRAEAALRSSDEQLRQAQKMEAVGQLAGGIAHDFNNLLTAITGYSDLAIRKLQPQDPLCHNLEEIKKAGLRAAGLTRQLLAFSRKQVLQPKVLNLNSIVSDLERMLHRLIGEDVELSTVLDPDGWNVRADPGQVEQVIMNLVINARDAMPEGGRLTIETQNIDIDEDFVKQHLGMVSGSYVMLGVRDTGVGMDETTEKRIFEPFFTTKEVGKGTGLGLSTVYGIVKQSNGSIWVYSELGHGTTFKVFLPRVGEGAQEYDRTREVEEVLEGTETILLIEDDDTLRRLAVEVLLSYGYKVLDAANGGAALLICERRAESIELLITDVVMPEMSGVEAAKRLGQIRPEMKTLFMSGYTNSSVVHEGVLEAEVNFIQKPFSPADLARKVRSVLDQ